MYALSFPGQEIKASTVGTSKDSKFVVWGPKAQNMWGQDFKRIGGRGVQVLSVETQIFQTSVRSGADRTGAHGGRTGPGQAGRTGRTGRTDRMDRTDPTPHHSPTPQPNPTPPHTTPHCTAQRITAQHSAACVCVCVCVSARVCESALVCVCVWGCMCVTCRRVCVSAFLCAWLTAKKVAAAAPWCWRGYQTTVPPR